MTEHDVRRMFRSVNTKKAVGPDTITGRVLKACADQLLPVFTVMFYLSLSQRFIPTCFEQSVPKKAPPTSLNDYRPIALTSVVIKCFDQVSVSVCW